MSRILAQWRGLGLPRCCTVHPDYCRKIIWPWQAYVFGFEDGPYHHSCHHRHLQFMHDWSMEHDGEDTLFTDCDHCDWKPR